MGNKDLLKKQNEQLQKDIDVKKEATPEQIEMLSRAADLPLPNDCDCPELTEEELRKFKRVSNFRDVD